MCDRKILTGIGIGMILSALIMAGMRTNYKMSDVEIYKRAKAMGMDYPDNFKVLNNGGSGK